MTTALPTTFFRWAFLYLLIFLFSGCSQSTNAFRPKNADSIYVKKITSGPWLMNSAVTTENSEIYDIFSEMDPREKDNALIFYPDQTVFGEEGELKYSENDPQVYQKGKWNIVNGGKTLQVIENGQVAELEILELTTNTLKLRAVDRDPRTNTLMSLTISYNH
jgi:hypothetical protein